MASEPKIIEHGRRRRLGVTGTRVAVSEPTRQIIHKTIEALTQPLGFAPTEEQAIAWAINRAWQAVREQRTLDIKPEVIPLHVQPCADLPVDVLQHIESQLTPDVVARLEGFMRGGQKIPAIKLMRESVRRVDANGVNEFLGLKDAKNYVEHRWGSITPQAQNV